MKYFVKEVLSLLDNKEVKKMNKEALELLKEYLTLPCAVFTDDSIELHRSLRNKARALIPSLENQKRQEEKESYEKNKEEGQ